MSPGPGTVVHLGPTLPVADARAILGQARFRPPVAQGDVVRAVRDGFGRIAIVDGCFEHVPAVWHKEILWALAQGVEVWGAASMGALRAAELHRFGMVGVGRVFEDFRDGRLEADDEVAVIHATQEGGYRPGSEALVDIRHTLARAEAAGVIGARLHAELLDAQRALHYPQRSLPAALGRLDGDDGGELDALRRWLPHGARSLKRADAVGLLRELAGPPAPGAAVSFVLARSVFFEALLAEIAGDPAATAPAGAVEAEVAATCERFGLHDDASFAAWLAQRGLSAEAFATLMCDRARLGLLRERTGTGAGAPPA